jgi:D-aspartate ligase
VTTPSDPPLILLGGDVNALSIARSLGRDGVRVYGIGVEPFAARSRHLTSLPHRFDLPPEEAWFETLTGPATAHLRGAVVLAASDVGLTVLTRHRDRLAGTYRLDLCDVAAQTAMLDKLATYRAAEEAGVPTPRFWALDADDDLERHRDDLVYPLIVKPLLSHEYLARFPEGGKFRDAADFAELAAATSDMRAAGLGMMLVERIPGPDDLLCSYYTYIDGSGVCTFDFTKRVLRRNPPGMGLATYHITDWNPEVRDVAQRLFKHAGLRGLANAEFKRDTRDGRLKLIECNARFTGANGLLAAAGLDLGRHVYERVLGRPHELPTEYTTGLRLLDLHDDHRAYRALRGRGELTLLGWLRSLAHRQTFPYLDVRDPMPVVAGVGATIAGVLRRVTRRS